MDATMNSGVGPHEAPAKRRDFLMLLTGAGAAIGVGAIAWPFIDSMNPSADVLAAGSPVDIDLTPVAPGQQIVVVWRGKPIFIVHRTPEALKVLQSHQMIAQLSDPNSRVHQQPPYAENWHRSVNPEWLVMVGICTHLGCLPGYFPNPSPTDPAPDWLGGYLCPCHGSKYDLSGRVFTGVPAPYNMPIPPYVFSKPTTVTVGQNPPGADFTLDSIVQI